MTARWDIFCKVVDNFGDAGVAWRLARHARARACARRCGCGSTIRARWRASRRASMRTRDAQRVARHRHPPLARATSADDAPADVVVEAFGCGLPDALRRRDGGARAAARLVRARIPERRALDRRRARPALAASAAPAHAPLLVSRIHADERRAAARAGALRARDAFRARRARRARRFWSSLSRAPARRRTNVACRSSAIRTRRCPRCSMRGPTATSR